MILLRLVQRCESRCTAALARFSSLFIPSILANERSCISYRVRTVFLCAPQNKTRCSTSQDTEAKLQADAAKGGLRTTRQPLQLTSSLATSRNRFNARV